MISRKTCRAIAFGRFCATLLIFSLIFFTTPSGVYAELGRSALRVQEPREKTTPRGGLEEMADAFRQAAQRILPATGLEELHEEDGKVFTGFDGPVRRVAANRLNGIPDILAAAGGTSLFTYHWERGRLQRIPLGNKLHPFREEVLAITFSNSGHNILAVTSEGAFSRNVHYPQYAQKQILFDFNLPSRDNLYPGSLGFNSDRTLLLVGGRALSEARIQNLDPEDEDRYQSTSGIVKKLQPESGNPISVAFHPDGKTVALGTSFGGVELWDLGDLRDNYRDPARRLDILREEGGQVLALLFSPDGTQLALGDSQGNVRVYEITAQKRFGKSSQPLANHSDRPVYAVSFRPEPDRKDTANPAEKIAASKIIAAAGEDGMIRLWDIPNEHLIVRIQGNYPIFSISFSPNGTKIAAGRQNNTLIRWDIPAELNIRQAGLEELGVLIVDADPVNRYRLEQIPHAWSKPPAKDKPPLSPPVFTNVPDLETALGVLRSTKPIHGVIVSIGITPQNRDSILGTVIPGFIRQARQIKGANFPVGWIVSVLTQEPEKKIEDSATAQDKKWVERFLCLTEGIRSLADHAETMAKKVQESGKRHIEDATVIAGQIGEMQRLADLLAGNTGEPKPVQKPIPPDNKFFDGVYGVLYKMTHTSDSRDTTGMRMLSDPTLPAVCYWQQTPQQPVLEEQVVALVEKLFDAAQGFARITPQQTQEGPKPLTIGTRLRKGMILVVTAPFGVIPQGQFIIKNISSSTDPQNPSISLASVEKPGEIAAIVPAKNLLHNKDKLQYLLPVATGLEENLKEAAEKFLDGLELTDKGRTRKVAFYLERKDVVFAFAPILALLDVRGKFEGFFKGYNFAGVVETTQDKDRLLAALGYDEKAQRLLKSHLQAVEEQEGETWDVKYTVAREIARRSLADKIFLIRVTQADQDLLAQLNRLLSWTGYRLAEDPAVQDAARLLLEEA